jgi:hypothetical protein
VAKFRAEADDAPNVRGAVCVNERGELVEREPRTFAVAGEKVEEVREIRAVKTRSVS